MARAPNTSAAVKASRRAKDDNEGLSDEERLWKTLDHFCSPPWAARAGLEHAAKLWGEHGIAHMIEPAVGRGHIAKPAQDYFARVDGYDVHDYGHGYEQRDWLDAAAWPEAPCCDLIMSNPPFSIAEEFVLLGLARARLGVALLLRLQFLEGGERHAIMDGEKAKLTQPLVFCERVAMNLGDWDPDSKGNATGYAWFFWSKVHDPLPTEWLPPGTRDRLWYRDDPAQFGKRNPLPLFPDPLPDFDVI